MARYRLRATRTQRYNTRMLRAGEEFETDSAAVRTVYLNKGGVIDVTDAPPSRTELRRMPKQELVEHLTDRGEEVSEDDSREKLLNRALEAG